MCLSLVVWAAPPSERPSVVPRIAVESGETMFYRMTRLHWSADRYDDVVSLAESMRSRVEAISGLLFAELATTGEGEGMIIAGYQSEADYQAASEEVASILGQLGRLLTSTPHGHQGTVVVSYGNAPRLA